MNFLLLAIAARQRQLKRLKVSQVLTKDRQRARTVQHRAVARDASALLVRGRVECADGVVNVVAESISPLFAPASVPSRDFR